jgi:tetratricopeptide (TPR) repeat protein
MAGMRFPGDVFPNGLFHGMGPPLLSSFKDLTGEMGKAAWIGIFAMAVMAGAASTSAVRAAPTTPVMIVQVQAALDKGDAGQAETLANAALKDGGMSAAERGRLLLYRGLAGELLGSHDAAVGDFTQALATAALPPDERAQALLQRGFLHDGQGRLEQATADYGAVIALKGHSFATALNNRANIYRRQNRLMEARRDYLAALSAGSGKPQYSYYGLGQIAEAQHDTLAARSAYAKAVAADADYSLAAERLAALGGTPDGVIADADKLVLRPPPASNVPPADAARGFRAATEASREADGTIVLRVPRSAASVGNVVLRQPARVPVERIAPRTAARPAKAPSARTMGGGLILRPALDQRDWAPMKDTTAQVQLGAWRSQAEADAGWDKARAKAGGLLDRLTPRVVTADLLGKGRYYRLRVASPAGQSRASLCDALAAKGLTCMPVRD